jgi:branched-chain amino acid transport system permease protein
MEHVFLGCGIYHENYAQDHKLWHTKLAWAKMILLFIVVFVVIPYTADNYWLSVFNTVGYTILGALGVQLLIGYCGQVTLGHAAFIAVGAYTSTLLILEFPWPPFLHDWGLAYPISILVAAFVSGIWSVLFGLPSARVKGFYLILTTMAAQFITVDFIITQYISQIGGRGQAFSLPPGTIQVGPWVIDNDRKVYFMMAVLTVLCVAGLVNLLRSRVGRAWVAIRDNDVSAEVMGINVFLNKLIAFFVAGFIGGVAGAFWISNLAAISPEHFTWFWSLWLVGVILIGGVGTIHGAIFGAFFMVLIIEFLQLGIMFLPDWITVLMEFRYIPRAPLTFLMNHYDKLLMDFAFIKDAVFGLAICVFLIFEPNGLSYRWWQIKNYFNLWPFSY